MTATEFDPILALDNPYPGLRSFETHESVLFFGREEHTRELLDRLALNRFLAVIGTSGSGKSSLVRAGLLPVLYRGYLVGTGSRWRIAIMRPGSAPLHAMTQALASEDVLGMRDAAELRKMLESSSYGLVKAVRAAKLRAGESLLLVVDQFEELFRFARDSRHPGTGAEAALFVSLLIQAAEEFNEPIYIVLTMRSEFLGDCTQFPGLAEALNRSQYLIPRLTLDQRQAAVERPLALANANITPRLVQRLLTDAGDDPDQLPVLQHALMRTFRHWRGEGERGPLDLKDYEDVSRSGSALDDHAQEIYTSLPAETQGWAERLFRCLTTTIDGRAVRRPGRLRWIYAVTGARTAAERNHINAAIRAYAARENSLLFCTTGTELTPRSVIDIAHESLIRKWAMLRQWVSAEAKNADWFREVANTVARGAALMEGSDLVHVEQLAAENRWNSAWAAQYKPKREVRFSRVVEFLRASREAQEERNRAEEERRNRELRTAQELAKGEQEKRTLLEQRRRLGWLVIGLMALAVIGLAGLARSFYQEREVANQQREAAETERIRAREAELRAEAAQNLANAQAVELQLLRATGAARDQLQKELEDYKDKAVKLERQAQATSNVKADPNDAANERIRKLQEEVALLQGRLRQRDLLLDQKSDSPPQQQQQRNDAETITALRGQVQALQTEVARLRAAPPTVVTTDSAPVFFPLMVPESSWQVYPAASPKFGILLDDLKRDSDTARMIVFGLPSSYAPPGGTLSNRDRVVKAKIDELSARHPCPSPPATAGDVACFLVSKKQTNSEGQMLGTVAIGQTAFAFHALAWRNAPIGTDVLSVAAVAAGKADASRAQKVETIAEVDLSTDGRRVVRLEGTDSYLYVGGLSTDNLLTLMAISTKSPWWPAGGKPDSRQEVEKKLRRAAGPQ
ncbi:MAG: hypothetical protein JNN08_30040, partial [Bryobacterales bacterium]|nr:hypothetical protein [Bryobacterales bacterium]